MSGNFVEQPASKLIDWKKYGELTNSELIMRNSFFIGNHHKVGEKEKELVVDVFNEFFISLICFLLTNFKLQIILAPIFFLQGLILNLYFFISI